MTGPVYIHDRINDLSAQAFRLAPRTAEEAADSGCTNRRPAGPRQSAAWDLIAEAFRLNMISEDTAAIAAEGLTADRAFLRPRCCVCNGRLTPDLERHSCPPPAGDRHQAWPEGGREIRI